MRTTWKELAYIPILSFLLILISYTLLSCLYTPLACSVSCSVINLQLTHNDVHLLLHMEVRIA